MKHDPMSKYDDDIVKSRSSLYVLLDVLHLFAVPLIGGLWTSRSKSERLKRAEQRLQNSQTLAYTDATEEKPQEKAAP